VSNPVAPEPAADEHVVRIGVIGTGRIGRMHAELLATSVPGARLAAVCDAVAPLAHEVGQALGVPVLESEHLIGDPEIDAVAICAPTDTHVPLLTAAAESGKAVFCEKPISLDLAEVDKALAVVGRTGTQLMVGFNRRFDASHAAVRDAVAGGAVGPPHVVRITSRDPGPPPMAYARTSGGIFLDMTIHDFDMARYVVGSEVVEVYAAGAVRVVPELAELGDVDTAVVTLWHENECLTVIDNSRRATYGYDQRVEVLGADALVASENPLVNTAVTRDAGGTRLATLPYFFIERYTGSYVRQWQAFVAAVSSGEAAPTTGHDGRAALVLGLAAKRSLLERRPVRVDEVDGAPKVTA
jgi:myo-inositol 2-dehydrogenase / D-chiro-inositol 1-dehydrogenase